MARRPRRPPATIERKIHFFRIDAGVNASGQPFIFDPRPALHVIEGLLFTNDDNGRYLTDENGNAIGVWPEVSNTRTALRFGQVRRNGLPQVEQAGAVNELNIADEAGLLEPVHVVFFEDNIVGADFNFYGPRLSRLGYYLKIKSGGLTPLLHFLPLLRNDVADQLNRLEDIALFDLRIKPAYADVIRHADESLGAAFEANGKVLDDNTEDIQLVLRASKGHRRGVARRLRQSIRNLIALRGFRENAERFQVKGRMNDTGKTDTIDLLKDQLISTKQVLRLSARSRAVQTESAFNAIEMAYIELRESLREAAELSQ